MRSLATKSAALRSCAAAAFGMSICCAAASAQDVEPIDPEATSIGEYGIQQGAFVLTPRLYVGTLYNDNPLALENGSEAAWAAVADASLGIVSTWRRHLLGIGLTADGRGYDEDFDSENVFNYGVAGNARIDLGQSSNLFGNASFNQLTEERGSANLPVDATAPGEFKRIVGEAGASVGITRTILTASGQVQTFDYDDVALIGGGFIDNDVRDFDTYAFIGDIAREFRSGYTGFAQVIVDERQYDDTGAVRDSTGAEGRVGMRAALTELLEGEFYAGYMTRDYDSFSTVDGFAFGAQLDWTPREAWAISLEGESAIEETNDAAASSFINYSVELSVLRSVLRSLSLGPTFGYQRNDFQGSGREDDVFWLGLDGRYELTRTVSIDAGYRFTERDTTLVGGSFDQSRFTVGITLRR